MDKKILFTLLLITSLILFLGCTNLGIEVTCPDGEVVNDIRDCVDENKLIPTIPNPPIQKAIQTITNCQELQNMDSDLAGNYTLENNIDCSDTINWNSGTGFTPLATFTGTLNGQDFTIKDLYINRPSYPAGIFSNIENATIKNIRLENLDITGSSGVGGISGLANDSIIKNIYVSGNITGGQFVGGIIGLNESIDRNLTIINAHNSSTVSSIQSYAGGIIGITRGAIIKNSSNAGNISSARYNAGGIAGLTGRSHLVNTFNTGNITATLNYAGGITGTLRTSQILNAYNTGKVTAPVWSGGLAAHISMPHPENPLREDIIINNFYNTGNVSNTGIITGTNQGADYKVNIINSYNVGLTRDISTHSGVLGTEAFARNWIIENNYWDITTTTQTQCRPTERFGGCISTNNEETRYFGENGIPFTELGFDGNWRARVNDHPIFTWQDDPPQPPPTDNFIFQIETTTNNQAFKFQTDDATNLRVDWGDGTIETYNGTGIRSHTYTTAKIYEISLNGQASRIAFGPTSRLTPQLLKDLLTPVSDGVIGITNAGYMFANTNVERFNATNFFDETSKNVTNMIGMFDSSTFNQDISNWNTTNVRLMGAVPFNPTGMFSNSKFNQPINNWNTTNVIAMDGMFFESEFNQPINNWNTTNVKTMEGMFEFSQFNQNINDWDTSNVTDMSFMFFSSKFNQPLNNWDVSKVETMWQMFYNSEFNQPINNWNTTNLTTTRSMFGHASFNQDIGTWDTTNVIDMGLMFENTPFDQDISAWDVSNVTNMHSLFYDSQLSTNNYDALLRNWSQLTLQPNIDFHAGNSQYCLEENARNTLINTYNWSITDAGKKCS